MAGNGFSHQPIKVEKIKTKYRTIKTAIPVPESIPMLEKMYEIEAQAMHGQLPMVWDRADDFQIKAPESPLKWFVKSNYYFRGLVDGEDYNLPKEAFEQVYIPDGFVDVVKSSFVMNNKEIHGDRIIGFESPVCTEVDSVEEFEYIQYQLDKNGSELLNYLNQVRG